MTSSPGRRPAAFGSGRDAALYSAIGGEGLSFDWIGSVADHAMFRKTHRTTTEAQHIVRLALDLDVAEARGACRLGHEDVWRASCERAVGRGCTGGSGGGLALVARWRVLGTGRARKLGNTGL